MMPSPADRIASLRAQRATSGIFTDFDGTLAPIVAHPDLARPAPGARDVLRALARSYALVAIVSGRPALDVRSLLPVPDVEVFGLYGLEDRPVDVTDVRDARPAVESVARTVEGAWVEDKGLSLAVHYRATPDPAASERILSVALREVATEQGLVVLAGKMVLELAPPETPGKGAVLLREVRPRALSACLYAGDDQADLVAFAALDQLGASGVATVKVAVRSSETPEALLDASDLVVEGPSAFVRLLGDLA